MIYITDSLSTLQAKIFEKLQVKYEYIDISNIYGKRVGKFIAISVKTANFHYSFFDLEEFISFFNRQELLDKKF